MKPTLLILPDGTPVEFPSKYLKYGNHCYHAITSDNQLIQVDFSKNMAKIARLIHTDIYLNLLKDSIPITGAEFENAIEKVFTELYGQAVQL